MLIELSSSMLIFISVLSFLNPPNLGTLDPPIVEFLMLYLVELG
jgi:hypothetical protein